MFATAWVIRYLLLSLLLSSWLFFPIHSNLFLIFCYLVLTRIFLPMLLSVLIKFYNPYYVLCSHNCNLLDCCLCCENSAFTDSSRYCDYPLLTFLLLCMSAQLILSVVGSVSLLIPLLLRCPARRQAQPLSLSVPSKLLSLISLLYFLIVLMK